MTAKRFTLIECNGNIEDGCTQNVYDGGEDVFELLDLLNSLNDENEQLKSDVYDWKASAEDYLKLGKSLKKENEQLKHTIKTMMENERTELGKSVLKQLYEAIQ